MEIKYGVTGKDRKALVMAIADIIGADAIEIEAGNEIEVLKRRKAELEDLYNKGRCEKNAFRRQCIAQEYNRKLVEYEALDEMC